MKISDLELNYIYTRDDDVIYKVIYINHNSNWAVCIRYSFNENIGKTIIIDNNWLIKDFNKDFHVTYNSSYYGVVGSLIFKENILSQREN